MIGPSIRKIVCILLTAVLMFVFLGSSGLEPENTADPTIERLNEFAAAIMNEKNQQLGYPGNQDVKLTDFYRWLLESGLDTAIVNNAGDPFNNTDPSLNTLDFEREVIEFFGPLYGFSPDDLWGIVARDVDLHGCRGTVFHLR